MTHPWPRRRFLRETAGASLGLLYLPRLAHLLQFRTRASQWKALSDDLVKRVPGLLEETRVPGASIALIDGAKVVWRRGFGVADVDTRAPVRDDTMFEVGSISKTVFAYAVMKLVERGVLALDTPLTTYVPERYLEEDPRLDLVTARHVLSHTTGFPNWRSTKEPLAIAFTPGERFSYSGEGYSYLQSVVTHLTGHVNPRDCSTFELGVRFCATDFDAWMRANFLEPFGMNRSGYLWNDVLQAHMARPHDEEQKPFERKASAPAASRYGSAGGLHTSPAEYAKFLIEVIDPQPADRFRLNAASRQEMLRAQVKVDDKTAWGLGWQLQGGGDLIMHGGSNPGFQSFAGASLSRKCGLVIATNGDKGYAFLKAVLGVAVTQQFLAVTI